MATNAEAVNRVDPKPKIFISYSRKDLVFADRLEAALKARGFEPLIDRSEIYAFEDWWKRIQALISSADTVVFVLSPDAVASKVALKEVTYAASLNKRFAPIVYRHVEDSAVPEMLQRLNFVFFDDPERLEASADRLGEALNTDIGWIRQHTQYGEFARHWSAAGRPAGLLLRSPALEEAEHWIASRPHSAPVPTDETRAFITESRRGATRRRNTLTGSLAVGLIVALALAGLAYWQRGVAIEQERIANERGKIAQSRELASRADAVLSADSQLALHLAIRGTARWQTSEAEAALRRALASSEPGKRGPLGHVGGKGDRLIVLSRTAKYGVTKLQNGRLQLWQLRPDVRQLLRDQTLSGTPLFSQDERLMAMLTSDGVLTVLTIEDGVQTGRIEHVQTANFSGFKGLTFLKVDRADVGSLILLDPQTWKRLGAAFITAPSSVRSAAFHPDTDASLYVTVDDRNVDTWNFYSPPHSLPKARYSEAQGISEAWFDRSGRYVVITNDNVTKVLQTANAMLVSTIPLQSLRTVAFGKGRFMVALPELGPPKVVDFFTGEILASLSEGTKDIASVAFDPEGDHIVFASSDGSIWQEFCFTCMTFEHALERAKSALSRPLTLAERQLYLHESYPHPCPFNSFQIQDCLELVPNSGPSGGTVEVSVVRARPTIRLTLADAAGKNWLLPDIEAPGFFIGATSAQRVGTLKIPEGAALGRATVSADGVTRSFWVICRWCDPD